MWQLQLFRIEVMKIWQYVRNNEYVLEYIVNGIFKICDCLDEGVE